MKIDIEGECARKKYFIKSIQFLVCSGGELRVLSDLLNEGLLKALDSVIVQFHDGRAEHWNDMDWLRQYKELVKLRVR